MVSRGKFNGNKDYVLNKVSEISIAVHYLPNLKEIPSVISSPIRKDEHPSFRIYSPDGTKIRYYDYATQQQGGIIDLIMEMYNIPYEEALEKVLKEVPNNETLTARVCKQFHEIKVSSERNNYVIRSRRRDWKEYDFEYWSSYGIPKEWVLHADIYPIAFIFIVGDNGYIRTIQADKYAYTFIERKEGIVSEKIYQPFNQNGYKWRSGHDKSVWDLWTKLPQQGDKLIITSSRKDALCIWAQTGIPAISMQSETASANPKVINQLKERFKDIYVLYDNDFTKERNVGHEDGEHISSLYGLTQIELPESLGCKDPSDLYHKYRGSIVKDTINYLINQQ